MEEAADNPLNKAEAKYQKFRDYGVKLANAASEHPQISYHISETPEFNIESGLQEELNEVQANGDITLYSFILNQEIDQVTEFYMLDFEREVDQMLRDQPIDEYDNILQKHDELQSQFDDLLADMRYLDTALANYHATEPLTEKEKSASLQPVNSTLGF